jgi:CRP/FNR family cyclic AMP-dependent transcriptional regulator
MTAPISTQTLCPPVDLLTYCEAHGREIQHEFGEYACWEGKPAHDCFYIESGKVDLQMFAGDLGFVTVTTLGPGDWLGWSWLQPPHLWHLSARAASPCTLRALDADALRRHCHDNPRFGYEVVRFFLQLVATRIHKTRRLLLEVC